MSFEKQLVYDFWNEASCGEKLYFKGESEIEKYANQLTRRYELEPMILNFAEFEKHKEKKVLEVGVGLGADHQMFAQNGANLSGCDLTDRAIALTQRRLSLLGLNSNLTVADAENLPYENESFDTVYSWGVIHVTPDTQKAANEIYRVLKTGGTGRVMIYHRHSMIGYMLWLRYALLKFKPFRSLDYIFYHYLESTGTKAYTINEAKSLFAKFKDVKIETALSHGDLLSSEAGQRHEGLILSIARKIYPRQLVKRWFSNHGQFMMIYLKK
ncbi:MAG: class I SAM-dependent methyltransferase [Saprospiraceae bacterium]|nr:class I SAM-dependent methyltransferase [Saprospiraceae bacterium]MBK8484713.1 class I SAM-dependent methyltransferase [Saprospiraceae bacterium]MBK9222140.1 class I SAM-dependent methyltransferase [Saprospiraceae bacterium]